MEVKFKQNLKAWSIVFSSWQFFFISGWKSLVKVGRVHDGMPRNPIDDPLALNFDYKQSPKWVWKVNFKKMLERTRTVSQEFKMSCLQLLRNLRENTIGVKVQNAKKFVVMKTNERIYNKPLTLYNR